MGQQGGLVPWDTRGTAWDSGTAPQPRPSPPASEAPANHQSRKNQTMTTNQPASRTAAEATASPELFHDVYWATNDRNPPPDIIRARNRFAIDWKLKSRYRVYAPVPPKGWPYGCDHPETYTDAEGWIVLLVSNDYGQPPPILGLRFVGYLYEGKVRSYAGRFASLRELRARLEAVEGAPKFGAVRHLFSEPPTPRRSAPKARGRLTV